jgi:hypothetical protein
MSVGVMKDYKVKLRNCDERLQSKTKEKKTKNVAGPSKKCGQTLIDSS